MTEDESVIALARDAGLEVQWIDANGTPRVVGVDTLRAVLAALELPAESHAQVQDSRARLQRERELPSTMIVANQRETIFLDGGKFAEIVAESGERKVARVHRGDDGRLFFRAPVKSGYYRIEAGKRSFVLAVAPVRALRPGDIAPGKLAGVSVQIYSLHGGTSGSFGDFAALGAFAQTAGRSGFDAVMTSPVHALFGAEPSRFSPYSPSTRFFINALFADTTLAGGPRLAEQPGDGPLIDWQTAAARKQRTLRKSFAGFQRAADRRRFETFCREGEERLLAHALFETLDAHFRGQGIHGFRNWPAGFDSPAARNVSAFAKARPREIEYQLFLQWLSARSAEAAQQKASDTMAIGVIADLAVGMDPQGSHAWSAPHELLRGLHVGAPPDAFQARGQDWGLTTLSPRALETNGFAPFVATLRATMRHSGGVRIDHALGLRRLWVMPAGASPNDGVYLRYPERELLRLIALESHRNHTIVIGEDLGTVPGGFRADLKRAGVLGMQVLWFERNDGCFVKPSAWRRDATATTTTHDLATVAGWWTERDIDWRKRTGDLHDEKRERDSRGEDRARLWAALRIARCVKGEMPPREKCEDAVAGALAYVGSTRCAIAFAPAEDLLADPEQPNLPGTTDTHPNWCRRMKSGDLFRDRAARKRIRAFRAARKRA